MWLYFIPIYIVGALVLLLAMFALLARVRGGKYARPVMQGIAKVPGVRGLMMKASRAALAKQNPDAASALEKLERAGVAKDPQRAQAALSRLSASERRAYLEDALAQEERDSFEHHLAGCTGCHEYVRQMRQTIELTGRLTTADVSPEVEAKLLAVFRDWKSR